MGEVEIADTRFGRGGGVRGGRGVGERIGDGKRVSLGEVLAGFQVPPEIGIGNRLGEPAEADGGGEGEKEGPAAGHVPMIARRAGRVGG